MPSTSSTDPDSTSDDPVVPPDDDIDAIIREICQEVFNKRPLVLANLQRSIGYAIGTGDSSMPII